jgi:hypothetical protein
MNLFFGRLGTNLVRLEVPELPGAAKVAGLRVRVLPPPPPAPGASASSTAITAALPLCGLRLYGGASSSENGGTGNLLGAFWRDVGAKGPLRVREGTTESGEDMEALPEATYEVGREAFLSGRASKLQEVGRTTRETLDTTASGVG